MLRGLGRFGGGFVALALLAIMGWFGYQRWHADRQVEENVAKSPAAPVADGTVPVKISPQARKNLGLVAKSLQPTTYWRTLDVPGVIKDRPGISDRGVVAPVTGVVTHIYSFPGDTVQPNAPLFSIRLVSESLHASQLELFKATKEIEITEQQSKRLSQATQSGALAGSRLIEVENQIQRLQVTEQAYRQDLQARGLPADRIDAAAKGEFVTEITVNAPGEQALQVAEVALTAFQEENNDEPKRLPFNFELQSLNVAIGQQVEAGHLLCVLADHRALMIEGRGFENDMPLLQESAKNGWEIEVEFEATKQSNWPEMSRKLKIHHVSNTVEPESRTFAFYLALDNQWLAYTQDEETRLLWRFRPGSRVRLHAPVEKLENVFVVPQQAVVREGPETFVFRQNGDLFDRRAVHVLHEDQHSIVLANDGSLRPGFFIAQNSAASLNRVLKAQAAKGLPADVHVHADGTTHAAH